MLDRIQNLAISSAIYGQIGCKVDDLEIFIPPTTQPVSMIEGLTSTLDYDSHEATNMDEDIDGDP